MAAPTYRHKNKQNANFSEKFAQKNAVQSGEPSSASVSSETADSEYFFQKWTPTGYTAFKALLSARLCAAIWSNISDCDETFNYWEPMHFLLYGYGYQTWEFSPNHAIRSYAFLWVYGWPLSIYNALLGVNKILQFYMLRCLMALACAVAEAYFYRAVCRQFGSNTGRMTLFILIFSSGMFISSTAFLPSSFTMYTAMIAIGAWYLDNIAVAVMATAAGAFLGWPFAAALGIPIAVDYLLIRRRHNIVSFLKWSILSVVFFLVPMVVIDSYYYGRLTVPPLNILLYNVFTDHGPDLYGVEHWTYYFINGFLNFNVAFPLALISLPLVVIVNLLLGWPWIAVSAWINLTPMYVWVAIFFTQPHKEERFLFPIYPLICLGAAISIDYIQKLYAFLRRHKAYHYTSSTYILPLIICIFFAIVSLSRMFALFYGYHAPLDVYGELQQRVIQSESNGQISLSRKSTVSICVGKEWYRFPSNFFLPHDKWRLQFIKSEFRGQLPKPYAENQEDATWIIPTHMNDENAEEPTRYVNISSCHYLVDLDTSIETELEPRYARLSKDWIPLVTAKFLDSTKN